MTNRNDWCQENVKNLRIEGFLNAPQPTISIENIQNYIRVSS